MRLDDCKVGARVRYFPIVGVKPGFVGVVREDPWQLGHGAWVTHVHQMEPAYRNGERSTVYAALVADLELCE